MKIYKKAPLPFLGQKRFWLKEIEKIDFEEKIVVDLFGGSGLLSHFIKRKNPSARVIYNDYDNYSLRLNQIEKLEILRQKLGEILHELPKESKINQEIKEKLQTEITQSELCDWITFSSWLCFSGAYYRTQCAFFKATWYKNVPQNPISAENYLDEIEIVHCDFLELIEKFKNLENVIFVADPPYILTDKTAYKNDKHFGIKQILALLNSLQTQKAILFSSEKSESDELLTLFEFKSLQKIIRETNLGIRGKFDEELFLINF